MNLKQRMGGSNRVADADTLGKVIFRWEDSDLTIQVQKTKENRFYVKTFHDFTSEFSTDDNVYGAILGALDQVIEKELSHESFVKALQLRQLINGVMTDNFNSKF